MTAPDERSALKTVHTALWVGCLLFLLVTCYLWKDGTVPMAPGAIPYGPWWSVVAAAVLVPVAFTVFRTLLAKVPAAASAGAMQQGVRAACIAHWALLEGAFFFADAVLMLEGDIMPLAVAAVLLGLLAWRGPTPARWERWMQGRP